MNRAYYRLTETHDPEERLEDAALWKALRDALGDNIRLVGTDEPAPKDGLFLGRGKRNEMNTNLLASLYIPYWEDPAFKNRCTRDFIIADFSEAYSACSRLLSGGNPVFLKSTAQKHYARLFRDKDEFEEEMESMAYSFIDRGPCLMVQQGVDMRFERRFLVIDREVVTQSPVAWHLTPMSRAQGDGARIEDTHFDTPKDLEGFTDPRLTRRMTEMARDIAAESDHPHLCVDLCVLGEDPEGPVEPVEWNPMQPGAVGLYACDPARIADAVKTHLDRNPGIYPGDPEEPGSENAFNPASLEAFAGDDGDVLEELEFEDSPSP